MKFQLEDMVEQENTFPTLLTKQEFIKSLEDQKEIYYGNDC